MNDKTKEFIFLHVRIYPTKAGTELSILDYGKSPLEVHHKMTAFKLLAVNDVNIFCNFSREQVKAVSAVNRKILKSLRELIKLYNEKMFVRDEQSHESKKESKEGGKKISKKNLPLWARVYRLLSYSLSSGIS